MRNCPLQQPLQTTTQKTVGHQCKMLHDSNHAAPNKRFVDKTMLLSPENNTACPLPPLAAHLFSCLSVHGPGLESLALAKWPVNFKLKPGFTPFSKLFTQ